MTAHSPGPLRHLWKGRFGNVASLVPPQGQRWKRKPLVPSKPESRALVPTGYTKFLLSPHVTAFLIIWRPPPVGFCRARVLEGGRPRRAVRTSNGASGALTKFGGWLKVTGDEVPGPGWCTVLSLFIFHGRGASWRW